MLDEILKWLEEVLEFGMHWPDLTSLVVGSIAGFIAALALELFFLPTTVDPDAKRRQKGYTFLVCWIMSTIFSALFWSALDPIDPPAMRWIVSATVTIAGFFFYPAIARYLTAKFPAIGTAWAGKP
jgi:hypothetical protein